jgi:hypothetical protein
MPRQQSSIDEAFVARSIEDGNLGPLGIMRFDLPNDHKPAPDRNPAAASAYA